MKLLFLTPQLPYPPHQGTAIRNLNLLKHIARFHIVDLLTFVADDETLQSDSPLLRLCRRIVCVPQPRRTTASRLRDTLSSSLPDMALRLASPHMHAALSRWLDDERYDVVQTEGIEMGRYGLQVARRNAATHIFDDHNCEYLLQKRNALSDLPHPRRLPAAAYSLVQWQKLIRFERLVMESAAATVAVSRADAAALRRIAPTAELHVAPNGIDLDFYTPGGDKGAQGDRPTEPRRLVFTGKMDYRPNIDGVLWFAQEVLPRIVARAAHTIFQIVGRNPHPRLDALRANPNIEITGAVEDIRPWIQHGDVYIIPLRVGGGTRFKALEAMACARPIVSTTLGVEGIGVQQGREMLLADSADAFADAVLTLLEAGNESLRIHLGNAARRFVEVNYAWPPIVDGLLSLYDRKAGLPRVADVPVTA